MTRHREFAIRAILGATAGRHVRQLLAESLVSAALPAAPACSSQWLSPVTAQLIPSDISEQLGLATLRTDWRVAGFAIAVSLASAIIAGAIPAFGSWRADSQATLAEGGRTMSGGGRGTRLLRALIVAETALTMVLLAGAGLVIQNFTRLRSMDVRIRTAGDTLSLTPSLAAHPPGAARAETMRRIVEEVRAVPGVAGAAVTTVSPLGGGTWAPPWSPTHLWRATPARCST